MMKYYALRPPISRIVLTGDLLFIKKLEVWYKHEMIGTFWLRKDEISVLLPFFFNMIDEAVFDESCHDAVLLTDTGVLTSVREVQDERRNTKSDDNSNKGDGS